MKSQGRRVRVRERQSRSRRRRGRVGKGRGRSRGVVAGVLMQVGGRWSQSMDECGSGDVSVGSVGVSVLWRYVRAEWPHLYHIHRAVLIVGAYPLINKDALVQLASQPPNQSLHREVRSRPVRGGDRPASEGLQHIHQRRVACLLDLAWRNVNFWKRPYRFCSPLFTILLPSLRFLAPVSLFLLSLSSYIPLGSLLRCSNFCLSLPLYVYYHLFLPSSLILCSYLTVFFVVHFFVPIPPLPVSIHVCYPFFSSIFLFSEACLVFQVLISLFFLLLLRFMFRCGYHSLSHSCVVFYLHSSLFLPVLVVHIPAFLILINGFRFLKSYSKTPFLTKSVFPPMFLSPISYLSSRRFPLPSLHNLHVIPSFPFIRIHTFT